MKIKKLLAGLLAGALTVTSVAVGAAAADGNIPIASSTGSWEDGKLLESGSAEMSGISLTGVDKVEFHAVALELNYGWNGGQFYTNSNGAEYKSVSFGGTEKGADVTIEEIGKFNVEVEIGVTESTWFEIGYGTDCKEGAFELESVDFYKGTEKFGTWADHKFTLATTEEPKPDDPTPVEPEEPVLPEGYKVKGEQITGTVNVEESGKIAELDRAKLGLVEDDYILLTVVPTSDKTDTSKWQTYMMGRTNEWQGYGGKWTDLGVLSVSQYVSDLVKANAVFKDGDGNETPGMASAEDLDIIEVGVGGAVTGDSFSYTITIAEKAASDTPDTPDKPTVTAGLPEGYEQKGTAIKGKLEIKANDDGTANGVMVDQDCANMGLKDDDYILVTVVPTSDKIDTSKCQVGMMGHTSDWLGYQGAWSEPGDLAVGAYVGDIVRANLTAGGKICMTSVKDLSGIMFSVVGATIGDSFDYRIVFAENKASEPETPSVPTSKTTVLSEEETVMDSEWHTSFKVEASKFADVSNAGKIVVTIKDVKEGAQYGLRYGENWTNITLPNGFDYSDAMTTDQTTYEVAVDAELLAILKANDLIITGHDYTAVKAEYVETVSGTAAPSVAIPEGYEAKASAKGKATGNPDKDGWTTLTVLTQDEVKFTADDVISFIISKPADTAGIAALADEATWTVAFNSYKTDGTFTRHSEMQARPGMNLGAQAKLVLGEDLTDLGGVAVQVKGPAKGETINYTIAVAAKEGAETTTEAPAPSGSVIAPIGGSKPAAETTAATAETAAPAPAATVENTSASTAPTQNVPDLFDTSANAPAGSEAVPADTTANVGNANTGNAADKNMNTGVMLAFVPVIAAAAGVIISKKKK